MSAAGLPRGAVLALAALILSFPAVLAVAGDYRKTPGGLIKHRHTDSYGVLNMVGTEDSQLRDAVNAARNQWDQKLQARDTVRLQGDLASPEIVSHRQGLGDSGAYVAWAAPYHPSDYTRMTFNSDKIGTVSNSLMQGIACKAFGGIMGLAVSGPQGGCMADSANVTPSNTSADNLDRFYGPNVDLAGSMYEMRGALKPSDAGTYSLTAKASGHAIQSVTVKIDGETIATSTITAPCPEKCSVTAVATPTTAQLDVSVDSVEVIARNEFGRSVTKSLDVTVVPDWGIAELWRNLPTAQIARTGSQAGGMGASSNRLDVGWADVQRRKLGDDGQPEPFDWSRYAATYDAMLAAGQRPILTLQSAPSWAGRSADGSVPTPRCLPNDDGDDIDDNEGCQFPPHPSHYEEWQTFVANAVCRFPQALAVEIWNEPNKGNFWRPNPDPNAYAALLHEARLAMDDLYDGTPTCAGAPSERPPLLVGGLAPIDPAGFLATFYSYTGQQPDPRDDFQGIGVHAYPGGDSPTRQANNLIASAKVVTDARDAADDPGKSIWLTEVGVPGGGGYGTEANQGVALEKIYQAAGTKSYPELTNEELIDAEVLLIYKWQEQQVNADADRFYYMGLTREVPPFEAKQAVAYLACALEGRAFEGSSC